MPFVESNGIKMHYEEQGSGEPLLFIMGLAGNRLAWIPVLPFFKDKYRCIYFDNRGTGQSDAPEGPYSMEQMADDAAGLIDALGIGPVNVIGWSMGGVVLQALCRNHPDKVKKAVLLSTLGYYTDIQHQWLDGLIALRKAAAPDLVVGVIGMPWVFTPRVMGDHHKAHAYALLGLQNPEPTSERVFNLHGAAIRVFDSRPWLHEVQHDALVIVGAEDVLTPVHQSVDIARRMPNATLHVVPRGSHAGAIEFVDDFSQAMLAFLEK
jgi:pimeloyl-ACP methyl ester carboxylesterase